MTTAKSNLVEQNLADIQQAWQDMLARPITALATLLAISATLVVPMLLILVGAGLTDRLDHLGSSPKLTVYLVDESSEIKLSEVGERLLSREDVGLVELVPKTSAIAEFAEVSGFGRVISELEQNPLPDALIVTPLVSGTGQLESLAEELSSYPEVDLVQLDIEWVRRLQGFTALIERLGFLVGAVALISFFLVIGNTIRLAVQQSEDEIRVLKLIGAPDSFILRPLLYSGAIYGLLASILAFCLYLAIVAIFRSLIAGYLAEYSIGTSSEMSFYLSFASVLILFFSSGAAGLIAAGITAYREILSLEP